MTFSSCLGGCGSGLGYFLVLAVLGAITILWFLLYLIVKKGKIDM